MDSVGAAITSLRYGEPHYVAPAICDFIRHATDQLRLPWTLMRELVPAPQGFMFFTRPPSEYRLPPEDDDVPMVPERSDSNLNSGPNRAIHALKGLARRMDEDGGITPEARETVWGQRPIPLRAFSWTVFDLPNDPPRYDEFGTMILDKIKIPLFGGGSVETAAGIVIQFYSEIRPGAIRPCGYTVWRFGRTQLDIAMDEHRRLGDKAGMDDPFLYGGSDNAAVGVTFLFLASKALAISPSAHMDRGTRRRLARDHPELTAPSVRVILLRRTDREGYIPPDDHVEIEWSCQWRVEGFWRRSHCMFPKQHRAGTCIHQPVWVNAHWKGPRDAPIKSPPETILYNVKR